MYSDLISKNEVQESGYRTYFLDEHDQTTSISLRENISIISDGTTGLCTWQVIKIYYMNISCSSCKLTDSLSGCILFS